MNEDKWSYQLWAKWNVQNADQPQPEKDWTLVLETTDPSELFIRQVELKESAKTMTTKNIQLDVEVL